MLSVAVVVGGIGCAVALIPRWGGAAQAQSVESGTHMTPTLAALQQTAPREAAASGDASPTSVEEVSCSLGEAARAIEPGSEGPAVVDPLTGKPWPDSQVYLVSMHGHFVIDAAAPRGHPAPSGTVLTIMIEASSGLVVGRSLSKSSPDLSSLGKPVSTLQG